MHILWKKPRFLLQAFPLHQYLSAHNDSWLSEILMGQSLQQPGAHDDQAGIQSLDLFLGKHCLLVQVGKRFLTLQLIEKRIMIRLEFLRAFRFVEYSV